VCLVITDDCFEFLFSIFCVLYRLACLFFSSCFTIFRVQLLCCGMQGFLGHLFSHDEFGLIGTDMH
jgi:hypothetical protein